MFTQDWFSNNIPTWKIFLSKFIDHKCNALEIGCFEGRATVWLLENILTNNNSNIVCIDTFEGSEEHGKNTTIGMYNRFLENTFEYKNKIKIQIGNSKNILKKSFNGFDLIYIDGSHKSCDVLTDAILSWMLLKSSGIMIFDDYLWHLYQPSPTGGPLDEVDCPKLAIDSFLNVFSRQYNLLYKDYQVILEKL